MTIPSLHLRDLGQPRRFHAHWPQIDTESWPGRELYWAYTHPALSVLILLVWVIIVSGYIHDFVVGL